MIERYVRTWAAYFDLPYDEVMQPGTTLKPNADYTVEDSILLWGVGERVIVQLAPDLVAKGEGILRQFPPDHRLVVGDFPPGETLLNNMYLVDPAVFQPFTPAARYTLRQLSEADRAAFDAFHAQSTEEEREEGDVEITHLTAYGAFDGERIAAVASTYIWRGGFIDIGVLVDPAYRGQGLGKAVVSACAKHHLDGEQVVVYRHDRENIGSRRIAEGLKFTPMPAVEGIKLSL